MCFPFLQSLYMRHTVGYTKEKKKVLYDGTRCGVNWTQLTLQAADSLGSMLSDLAQIRRTRTAGTALVGAIPGAFLFHA